MSPFDLARRLSEAERVDCPREPDVIDAIASRRWPDRADTELRDHVHACSICADLAVVAAAIGEDQEASWSDAARLPSAQVVWLRAQARARAEAARRAARPIAVMQALGFATAAALISVCIGAAAWWVWSRTDLMAAALPTIPPDGLKAMGLAVRGILLAIGLWLVLAPVAVYLAAVDE